MTDVPIVMTKAGRTVTTPATLRAELIAAVAADVPGYTANLPGSLIEDVSSTEVAGLSVADSFVSELINSLTPYGANAFLNNQLGQVYGVPKGVGSNGSVYVTFYDGTPGYQISQGFTVSDGTYQYVLREGGTVKSDGTTSPLYAVASLSGTWAIPENTVTTIVTSLPAGIALFVTNPQDGTPASSDQTEGEYRAQVLEAGLAAATGFTKLLKTALKKITGVQSRLVSVRQATGGWEVLVGGGDPYEVGGAIFDALFWLPGLVGSTMMISGITKANPGVVTTELNHGLATGQSNVYISDALGMTGANGGPYTVTVLSPTTFSFGVDTTGFGTYTGSGVVTPNARNIVVSINDYPDVYTIPFVNPPLQTVTMAVTWNTTSTNSVSDTSVAQAAAPAIADYVNAIAAGVSMNLFELQSTFQTAVESLIATSLLTRLVFAVSIDGIGVSPEAGTGIIAGDSESYFSTASSNILIVRG